MPHQSLPEVPPPDQFLFRAFHGSAVVRDHVYLEGGEVAWLTGDGRNGFGLPSRTIAIPLNHSWANNTVDLQIVNGGPSPNQIYERPELLVHKDADLYLLNSRIPDLEVLDRKSQSTFCYFRPSEPRTRSWMNLTLPSFEQFPRYFQYYTSSISHGFYAGGSTQKRGNLSVHNNERLPFLTTFEFATGKWRQISSPFDHEGRFGGKAVHIPTKTAHGVVLFLGGTQQRNRTYIEGEIPMNNITLFDPATESWHWQKTSGQTPTRRSDFCACVAQGTKGTTEIFIFGGGQTRKLESISAKRVQVAVLYGDIYILSIPGFRWFHVSQNQLYSRMGHTCELVGRRQMLVIGGTNERSMYDSSAEKKYVRPDPLRQGLGIFDMSALKWMPRYDPDAANYEAPEMIQNWYRHASSKSIEWSSEAVRHLFDFDNPNSNPFGSEPQSSPSESSFNKIGAIIGSISGVLILMILILGYYIFRYKKQRRSSRPLTIEEWKKPELAVTSITRPDPRVEATELPNIRFPGSELPPFIPVELDIASENPTRLSQPDTQIIHELDAMSMHSEIRELEHKKSTNPTQELAA